MTSYSLYDVNRLVFTDGELSTDPETSDHQFWCITYCLASGCARGLLNGSYDIASPNTVVEAEQWHRAREGWELDALNKSTRDYVLALVEEMLEKCFHQVIRLAESIAYGHFYPTALTNNFGMSLYSVGEMLACEMLQDEIGFSPDGNATEKVLYNWAARIPEDLEFFIDSSEEPCLLKSILPVVN